MRLWHLIAFLAGLGVISPALAQEEDREGGIIGTGIVGTITHRGSINVNGQRILIDDALDVAGAVTPMTAADLHPGHIVAVTVHPDGADWRAHQVRQILPLIGPIETVGDTSFTVLGTQVDLAAPTAMPQVGDWVAVSGLWQGRAVKASRLDIVPQAHEQARVSGTYFGADADDREVIGGTMITGIDAEHLQPGNLVRVIGQPVSGGIEATRLERNLFEETIRLVQVEGYLSPPQPSGLYTVLGSGLVAYTDQPEMIDAESRTVVCGEDGRFGPQAGAAGDAADFQPLLERLNCPP